MGKPAARLTDMHVCPMVTPGLPPIPHVGGPIIGPGCPTVLIGGMPAAVIGDMCTCVGPPDSIVLGSTGVFFGKKPAARVGDSCAHGGTIVLGCPTVLIGETGSGGVIVGSGSRSIEDLNSLEGASEEEVEKLIPANWKKMAMKKGEGKRFMNPDKSGEVIIIEKGWPDAKDILHSGPYLRVSKNGKVSRIPLKGNKILKNE